MIFDSSRKEGFPTHYEDQHSVAHTDVVLSGIACSIAILAVSFLILLPGFSGFNRKIRFIVQLTFAICITGVILCCNYGHSWEVGKVKISSLYKPASSEEIKGELGIKIALRGINITLTGEPRNASGQLANEVIDYNEHFSWEWAQGRFGFGYYAGRISRDFRAAVLRGSPLPILQLAEYFTFDGEGLRFGRYYRWAGWYSHALMWAAFPIWILSLTYFRRIIFKGATYMILTGVLQLLAVIVWSTLRNPLQIKVPFESEDQKHEVMLSTKYGTDFYLVLANSFLCIVGGVITFVANIFYPETLCSFFGVDVQTLYTDVVLTKEEMSAEKDGVTYISEGSVPLRKIYQEYPEIVPRAAPVEESRLVVRRKRSSIKRRSHMYAVNVNHRRHSKTDTIATGAFPHSQVERMLPQRQPEGVKMQQLKSYFEGRSGNQPKN